MTIGLPTLQLARPSATILKQQSQISTERSPLLGRLPILPASPVCSLASAFCALGSSSPSFGSLRVQSPPLNPFLGLSSRQVQGKQVAVSAASGSRGTESEEVFFDGGVHFGDLVTNLVFGLTLVWLPLTIAAIFRNLFLRYRVTNLRITIVSGLLGGDRKDFGYDVVKDVKTVPRFIGEWGDLAVELTDGTKVDFRCVPKFREIAKYIQEKAAGGQKAGKGSSTYSPASSPATSGRSKKGFS